jgi:hypothetical protein
MYTKYLINSYISYRGSYRMVAGYKFYCVEYFEDFILLYVYRLTMAY